jgi:hypothetical protein
MARKFLLVTAGFESIPLVPRPSTFDITNPQSPAIIKTTATPYGTASTTGGWAQIATNLFVFGGVIDTNGKNAILQVDISDPLNPVLTTFDVPSQVTNMVVSGNILHTTNGSGGYAAYQIPGVSATNYALTGNCAGPSSWGMSPSGVGTLSSTGLYTAPATVNSTQTVVIAVSNVNDPTQAAEAGLTLSPVLTITLSSSQTGPYITGNALALQAAVATAGTPVSGQNVTLTVTGTNPGTFTAVTNSSGIASFSYTGAIRGADSTLATAGGYSSFALTANWMTPSNPITTTEVNGQFYTASSCASGCEAFTTTSSQVPVFVENFPDLLFDPFNTILPSNSTGIGSATRPFTDIAIDNTGAPTGTIVVQGNGSQAGVGSMLGFSAVLRGSFVVTQAGDYTLNVGSVDGFILGVSGGAARVSGVDSNPPASGTTAIAQYPVLTANNGPSTDAATPIVIAFPAPGAYPYEFDYKSGTGGPLSLGLE